MNQDKITYFAETDARGKKTPFGIKAKDRTRHMYVIGKTGMGKSTMLENLAAQDISNGEGFAFIDPHGKTADLLLEYIPPERIKDVVYFAPFDIDNPIAFNIMEDVGADKRHLVAAGLMSAFKKIWVDAWSARMEYILGNVILALLEYPGATMLSINRMLTDKDYRKAVIANVQDPSTKSFWVDEFSKYTDRYTQEATPAIQNKVGQFTANPLIRNMVGQTHSSFDVRKMMDEKKILIMNLSKGQIGEGNANLLGSMIITKIYLAAMSRADVSEAEMQRLPNFYMYVDEFQSFANESFADILSEARKYKLNLTIAHQYIEQMSEEVRAAVFGNVGTMVTFRVGAYDSEVLEKEFAPVFTAEDLVNLGAYQIYLKLMIDGIGSHPFSAMTISPIALPEKSNKEEVIENSRKQFARPKMEVEEFITEWYKPVVLPKKPALKKESTPTMTADGVRIVQKDDKNKSQQSKISSTTNSSSSSVAPVKKPNTQEADKSQPVKIETSIKKDFAQTPSVKKEISKESTVKVTPTPKPTASLSALDRKTTLPKNTQARYVNNNQNRNTKPRPVAPFGGDNKGPSAEKTQSLKDALFNALKEQSSKNGDANNNTSTPTPTPLSKPMPNTKESQRAPQKPPPKTVEERTKNINEVPEETLKKILGQ